MGILSVELHFGEAGSLKAKRQCLRRMRDTLTRRHGVSFAEVGYQDLWQRSQVVVAVAASDPGALARSLAAAVDYLDSQEWEVVGVNREVVEIDA
ncbi:MAG: hypothetical protein Kow00122_02370 [Thermoleophilia bacterium]